MALDHRVAFAALLLVSPPLGAAAPLSPGLHTSVVFDHVSPLSSTAELIRRTFSPLAAQRMTGGASLTGHPIKIAQEQFLVYVPARKPP